MPEAAKVTQPACDRCGLVHVPLIDCVDAMKQNQKAFLLRTASIGTCRGCGANIFWVNHLNGKAAPYTDLMRNHFIDCPNRGEFKR